MLLRAIGALFVSRALEGLFYGISAAAPGQPRDHSPSDRPRCRARLLASSGKSSFRKSSRRAKNVVTGYPFPDFRHA
jgi:hypothetical protein